MLQAVPHLIITSEDYYFKFMKPLFERWVRVWLKRIQLTMFVGVKTTQLTSEQIEAYLKMPPLNESKLRSTCCSSPRRRKPPNSLASSTWVPLDQHLPSVLS